LARRPLEGVPGLRAIAADLLDPASLQTALTDVAPTHMFITAWMRQATEAENIRVNGAMVRHVSLVTGLKHYLGPFEACASAVTLPKTPLREEQPRLAIENFYDEQKDEVFAAAARDSFSWNVHRPHTVVGKAVGHAMNMGTTPPSIP
jgi:hypothetical protein